MYESAIQFIGVTVAFCAIAVGLFFIIGLTMNYGWQVMQNAVGFYRLLQPMPVRDVGWKR